MSLASANVVSVSANGDSDWIAARPGYNHFSVCATSYDAGMSWTLWMSDYVDGSKPYKPQLNGADKSVTGGGDGFVVEGPGYVFINVSSIGTTSGMELKRNHPA